jgi:hypothetical protein
VPKGSFYGCFDNKESFATAVPDDCWAWIEALFIPIPADGSRAPSDHDWRLTGPLEKIVHPIGMFARRDPMTGDGLSDSGSCANAGWPP